MKKILILMIAAIWLFGCEEMPDFPNYKYTSVYFPLQTPMRTLVLGDYTSDNSLDNNLQFNIGVALGGLRANDNDEWVRFEIDYSMVDGFVFSNGDTLEALPTKYYTTSPASGEKILIKKGSLEGKVLVSLTPEFLNNPGALKNKYVIPVKIIEASSGIDTILQGKPVVSNPNPMVASDWEIAPKNYTVFGIKYVNEYHGNYLLRGKDVIKNPAGDVLDQIVYRTKFVENNEIKKIETFGAKQVLYSGPIRKSDVSLSNFSIDMAFTDATNCTLTNIPGTVIPISGTGKYVKDGGEFGGLKHDAIFLNYTIDEKIPDIVIPGVPFMVDAFDDLVSHPGDKFFHHTRFDADLKTSLRTEAIGAIIELTFEGSEIAFTTYKHTKCGMLEVYIDDMDTPVQVIDNYGDGGMYEAFRQGGLSETTHTIRLVNSAKHNPKSAGYLQIWDFFMVTPHTVTIAGGRFLHNVNDTLVFRDKGIVFETFGLKKK